MGIKINTGMIGMEPDYASEIEFAAAVREHGWMVISGENYDRLTTDINDALAKAEITGISRADLDQLEKAIRDRSKLVKKIVTDKNGKKTTKWVKPMGSDEPEEGKEKHPHADAIARHEHNTKVQRMSKDKSLAHVERHFGKEAADHIRGKKEDEAASAGKDEAPKAGGKKNTPQAQKFLKDAQKRGVKGLEDLIDPEEEESGEKIDWNAIKELDEPDLKRAMTAAKISKRDQRAILENGLDELSDEETAVISKEARKILNEVEKSGGKKASVYSDDTISGESVNMSFTKSGMITQKDPDGKIIKQSKDLNDFADLLKPIGLWKLKTHIENNSTTVPMRPYYEGMKDNKPAADLAGLLNMNYRDRSNKYSGDEYEALKSKLEDDALRIELGLSEKKKAADNAAKPDGLEIGAPFVGAKEPHQKLANAVFEELREMYEGSDEGDDAVIEFSSDLAEVESVEDIISILDDRGFNTDDTDELMSVIVPAIVNSQPQAKKSDGETVLKKVMTDYASEQINEISDMPASDLRELKRNMKQADTYGEILEAAGFEDMHFVAIGAMMEWAFGKK